MGVHTVLMLVVLALFAILETFQASDDKLIFLQAVWRHGDRNPTETFPTDVNQEDAWPQGWGQLTPEGIQQHLDLAYKKLGPRYIGESKLLNPKYDNKEIYITSTDVNRTILSAVAHTMGLYYNKGTSGTDFPTCCTGCVPCWPWQYVPVPIHTEGYDLDYILNPDAVCKRQDQLWENLKKSPQFKAVWDSQKNLINYVSSDDIAGMQITPENLWFIQDTLYIEQLKKKPLPPWAFTVDAHNLTTFDKLRNLFNDVLRLQNGVDVKPYNGVDYGTEIARIRGGSLLWALINKMQEKIQCIQNSTLPQCEFYGKLKYNGYSAHDSTLTALFRVLGFEKTNYKEDGWPHYASAVTVELWATQCGEYYTKFYYWPSDGGMEDITPDITGCPSTNDTGCPVDTLFERSRVYRAYPDIVGWCATSLFNKTDGSLNTLKTSWTKEDSSGFFDFDAEEHAQFIAKRRSRKGYHNY